MLVSSLRTYYFILSFVELGISGFLTLSYLIYVVRRQCDPSSCMFHCTKVRIPREEVFCMCCRIVSKDLFVKFQFLRHYRWSFLRSHWEEMWLFCWKWKQIYELLDITSYCKIYCSFVCNATAPDWGIECDR